MKLSYDPTRKLMTFSGPGGFTQIPMPGLHAEAIATVLGLPLGVRVPA